MKFTGALSTLLVILPLLALQVNAAPSVVARSPRGKGGNKPGAAGASSAATDSAAAAAATGTAAAGAAANATATDAAAAGSTAAAAAAGAGGDPQTSLTLDPSVIGPNLAKDGQAGGAEAGQVASATSTNNFINSCVGKTITNGLQAQGGSCNPVPMGDIPSKANQPACKFASPANNDDLPANQAFTVKMNIQGMQTGAFVNPNTNYFAAPQALNGGGQIIGHSHIVIQALPSVTSTTPLDPTVFAFFQGLNAPAANGVLSANVAKGLPAGAYRMFSINTAANHQPVVGPVAQHGSFDDAVYFTVGGAGAGAAGAAAGAAAANGTAAAGAADAAAAPTDAAGAAATSSAAGAAGTAAAGAGAATGKGGKGGKGGKAARRSFKIARRN